MDMKKEVAKLCISFFVGTATALTARFLKRKLIERRGPSYPSPTRPDFADEDWEETNTEEKKIKAMQVMMSQPGLLFGLRNPWLAAKEPGTE